MRCDCGIKLRLRLWFGKGVELWCAALCGVFVSLGLLSLSECWRTVADHVVQLSVLTVFFLTVVFGIYRRPRLMPKGVFALSQMITAFLCPAFLVVPLFVLLYPMLLLPLLLGARWRGARFAALPLTLMFALALTPSPRTPPPGGGEEIPNSLYLPASLSAEERGGFMLVFGDAAADDLLADIGYRSGWLLVDGPLLTHGVAAKDEEKIFEVAIAGRSSRFCGIEHRKGIFKWLLRHLKPNGVLVLPAAETLLLPPGEWCFSSLPGGGGRWVAARRGAPVCVDPEVLDARIWKFAPSHEEQVLPRGAFSAMYRAEPEIKVALPRKNASVRWSVLAVIAAGWVLLRLVLCRRAYMGTTVAAAETAAAMVVYSMSILPMWGEHMLDTGIRPTALFAGIGVLLLPRPFSAVRRGLRILTGAALGVLPWMPGFTWCWLPSAGWFCWFFAGAAVFTGLRAENRTAALAGAVFGAAVGFPLYLLVGGDSPLPVCVAVLLMVPSWLRR